MYPLFIAQCLTCNCKLFEKQRPRIRHPSNLLVETPMKDNTEEAERRLGEVSDCDTGLTGGLWKERGKEGRLGRKSLRPQCSSEQVLARLRWGPHKGCSLEKGHIGQERPRSRTPTQLRSWQKVVSGRLDPQWIQRHSMCDCHPPRSPGRFPGERAEWWTSGASPSVYRYLLTNETVDKYMDESLKSTLEAPSWPNWTNCRVLQLVSCRADSFLSSLL